MSLRPDHLDATLDAIDRVRDLNPAFLVCPFDSRIAAGFDGTRRTGVSTFPFDERIGPAEGRVAGTGVSRRSVRCGRWAL